jgi:hypothetical protein
MASPGSRDESDAQPTTGHVPRVTSLVAPAPDPIVNWVNSTPEFRFCYYPSTSLRGSNLVSVCFSFFFFLVFFFSFFSFSCVITNLFP